MRHSKGKGLGKDTNAMYHLWEFDSIKELCDYAKDEMNPERGRGSSNREAKEKFNLTESFDDAYRLATDGWHGIREKVDGHLQPLREKLGATLSVVRENQYDIVGGAIDMDRYLNWESECMIDEVFTEQPHNGKVFTLLIDSAVSWYNDADDLAKRGATLCGLVEAFSMLGFQLEIWGEWTVGNYSHKRLASWLCRFNNAGEPIDIDTMMFAIGHPDWLRRIGFAAWENTDEMANHYGAKEGHNYGVAQKGAHHAHRVGASSIVSLEGNRPMVDDPVRWILDQLEEQGVIDSD